MKIGRAVRAQRCQRLRWKECTLVVPSIRNHTVQQMQGEILPHEILPHERLQAGHPLRRIHLFLQAKTEHIGQQQSRSPHSSCLHQLDSHQLRRKVARKTEGGKSNHSSKSLCVSSPLDAGYDCNRIAKGLQFQSNMTHC